MGMKTRYAFVCLNCGFSDTTTVKYEWVNCPKCGKPLLWHCPACGMPLRYKRQQYCGRNGCEYKDVPLSEVLEKIKTKELLPKDEDCLNEVMAILNLDENFEEYVRQEWEKLKRE